MKSNNLIKSVYFWVLFQFYDNNTVVYCHLQPVLYISMIAQPNTIQLSLVFVHFVRVECLRNDASLFKLVATHKNAPIHIDDCAQID